MTDKLNLTEDARKDPTTLEREIDRTRAEMNETLDALEQKLTAGQLLDQCLRFFGKTGSEMGSSLGKSVQENPIPLILTGTGIAWMMFSPGRRSTARSYDFGTSDQPRSDVPGAIAETSSRMGEQLKGAAEIARSQVAQSADAVKDTVTRTTDAVKDTVNRTTHTVKDRMAKTRNLAHVQAQRARNRFHLTLEEQPLVLGAIGIAVGAAIGALLPSTEQEDRLMGEVRDKTVTKGKEFAATSYSKGVETATQAIDRIAQEAKTSVTDGNAREP